MKRLLCLVILLLPIAANSATDFDGMLAAAKNGDSTARVVVAYAYYLGQYRDGTLVEQSNEKAYAWASLANYQGNEEAKKLVGAIIPKLTDIAAANKLAGEYFKKYGAERADE